MVRVYHVTNCIHCSQAYMIHVRITYLIDIYDVTTVMETHHCTLHVAMAI